MYPPDHVHSNRLLFCFINTCRGTRAGGYLHIQWKVMFLFHSKCLCLVAQCDRPWPTFAAVSKSTIWSALKGIIRYPVISFQWFHSGYRVCEIPSYLKATAKTGLSITSTSPDLNEPLAISLKQLRLVAAGWKISGAYWKLLLAWSLKAKVGRLKGKPSRQCCVRCSARVAE